MGMRSYKINNTLEELSGPSGPALMDLHIANQ